MLSPADIIFTGYYRDDREDRPEFMVLADGKRHFVEQITDRYSLPMVLRWWQPDDPRFWGPALGHDIRLEVGIEKRSVIDNDLVADMKEIGIERRYRWATWWGVRLGSWSGYKAPAPANRPLVQSIRSSWPHVEEWRADTLQWRKERAVERLNVMRMRWGLPTRDTLAEYRTLAGRSPLEFKFLSNPKETRNAKAA